MKLTYPRFIAWRVDLSKITDPLHLFNQKNQRKLEKGLALLKNSPLRLILEDVDQAYIEKFLPIYQVGIQAMKHGEMHDVASLKDKFSKQRYQAVSLYEGERYLGGQIFCIFDQKLSVNYRMFPRDLPTDLPVNIGFLADYLFYEHALHLGKTSATHGRDRNIFGPHSNISLARYKLEVGGRPFVSMNSQSTILHDFEPPKDEDALVFLGEQPGAMIQKAILFLITPETEVKQKYGFVLKHFPIDIQRI